MNILYKSLREPARAISNGISRCSDLLSSFSQYVDLSAPLTHSDMQILDKNTEFRDIHKGRRCFVIANGPSLKSVNLKYLYNEITFTMSGIWKHELVRELSPTYYSLIDPEFFKDNRNTDAFFDSLASNLSSSIFFMPINYARNFIIEKKHLELEKCRFTAFAGPKSQKIDLAHRIRPFRSVSSYSISLALYMGCTEIYLLGFDHNYLANRNLDQHFYNGGTLNNHKNSYTPLSELHTYYEYMHSMIKLWDDYYCLDKIANEKKAKIFNVTENSYLDIFERIRFNDLFYA